VREIDVLELETKVLELEISEAELVMKLSDTEYALHKAMAGPPGTRIIFSGTINATERGIELSENTDAWGALAVDRSPECMEARLEFEQVRAEVENASSAWIPSLGLSGTASMEGTRFPLDNFSWSVGLSISFTEPGLPTKGSISMGGAVNERNASWSTSTEPAANISAYASIQARSLALLQARERIATAQADAMRNLESLCARYRASSRARDVCARRRDAAVKKRVLSRLLLDAGRITRSDFMKVEEDLSRAETGLVDAALALVQAQRALERVLDIPPGDLGVFIKANEVRK
jgi:outer membrane protein TolC